MTKAWRVLVWCVVLGITGCDDDSDTPVPTRTPTVRVGATLTSAPATSTATSPIGATATYTPLTCPPTTPTATSVVACSPTGTPTLPGTFPQNPTPTPGLAVLRSFEANPRHTSRVFLPLQEYTPDSVRAFTEETWIAAARAPLGAAADGASLLLISVQLVSASDDAAVQLQV